MAIVVTYQDKSLPMVAGVYNVTGLINGANSISLPTPPAAGSFPVDPTPGGSFWTPTQILCFPYNTGAVGATVTPDYSTIVNTAGTVTFTLYASGNTNCFIVVW